MCMCTCVYRVRFWSNAWAEIIREVQLKFNLHCADRQEVRFDCVKFKCAHIHIYEYVKFDIQILYVCMHKHVIACILVSDACVRPAGCQWACNVDFIYIKNGRVANCKHTLHTCTPTCRLIHIRRLLNKQIWIVCWLYLLRVIPSECVHI